MSAFDLLADEDLLYQHQIKKPQRNKKKVQQSKEKLTTQETEFTKIHLNEIWIVILKYMDFKTMYTSFLFVDKKISAILYTTEFQKFILGREFADVLSGEYELDHADLYSKNMNNQRSLETILKINDPSNIFEFRKTDSNPTSKNPHKVFENLYFGLLNRKTQFFNRNMKLRKLIRAKGYLGSRCEVDFDTYKRGKMKHFKGAQDTGFGILDNETIPEIEKEARKRIECEHFNVIVQKSTDPYYPFLLRCKTCNATDLPFKDKVMKEVEKYL